MMRFWLALLLTFSIGAVLAQVPGTLSYQGLLTDNSGNPVADGTQTILFNFYTTASGGTALQTRGPLSVTTSKGLFMAVIGNGQGSNNAALPFNLADQQIYIGIVANGGNELSPRVQLTAVPYAFRAAMATALDATATVAGSQVGTGINANNITIGTLPAARIGVAAIDNVMLANGIDATKITTGTLPAARIGTGVIDNTKVASGIDAAKITVGTLPESVIPSTVGIPIGSIQAWAGSDTTKLPTGWLLCDGKTLSRTTYSALFNVLNVSWGGGNGSTTFNKPDLRGRFLRGRDGGAGVDPDATDITKRIALYTLGATGDNVGSYQGDELKSHTHTYIRPSQGQVIGNINGTNNGGANSNVGSTGGNETRPKNAYVNYIIKVQ